MSALSSILEKARQLRALRDGAATREEAEAAARAMAGLFAKYRISEAELEASTGQPQHSMSADEDNPLYTFKRRSHWKTVLAFALTKAHGVMGYILRDRRGGEKRLCLCGRTDDVELVRHMWSWLSAEATRLAENEPGPERQSWLRGFVHGVGLQILRGRKDAIASSSAMILLDQRDKEASDYMKTVHGKIGTKSINSSQKLDARAFERGRQAGASTHLGARLEEPQQNLLDGGGQDKLP